MKRALTFISLILLFSACTPASPTPDISISLIVPTEEPENVFAHMPLELSGMEVALVADITNNQEALLWQGLVEMSNMLNIAPSLIETTHPNALQDKLVQAAGSAKLVFGTGGVFAKAVSNVAVNYPQTAFVCIDCETATGVVPDNVVSIAFNEQEAAYLTGVIAGLTTQSGKIGVMDGVENDEIGRRFRAGFESGVKYANPDAQISARYCGAPNDAAKSKETVQALVGDGCDVLFCGPGAEMTSAVATAVQNKTWIIGAGQDWSELSRGYMLTSACVLYDKAAFKVLVDYKSGMLSGGQIVRWGVADGIVGVAESSKLNVENSVLEVVRETGEKMKTGEIKIS